MYFLSRHWSDLSREHAYCRRKSFTLNIYLFFTSTNHKQWFRLAVLPSQKSAPAKETTSSLSSIHMKNIIHFFLVSLYRQFCFLIRFFDFHQLKKGWIAGICLFNVHSSLFIWCVSGGTYDGVRMPFVYKAIFVC